MNDNGEKYFFDLRSRLLNVMEKFKQVCDANERNFKVEVKEKE